MKRGVMWLVLVILLVPTFSLMLQPGVFTMHDPHLFRAFEFNKCIHDGVFPCRWAPDSGKGFGEPLFNFYAQAPYWFTQKFIVFGFSILDSVKIVFILSLVLSGLTMFLYARRLWGNYGGLVSALFYIYAPYRAVDVWVRGAMPEALAFVLYPLILLFLDLYLDKKNNSYLLCFSVILALLINIHNLSFLMFLPFLGVYWFFRGWRQKKLMSFWPLAGAGIFSILLSAFYLLPVIFESSLVTLGETVKDYYDYHIHFTTLRELFISRFWGYGASLWQKKYLSVSIGQLHWILPLLILPFSLISRYKLKAKSYLLFFVLGIAALFLTHGKSSINWNFVPVMKFIQFPWRFLSVAVFFLSMASGYVASILNAKYLNLLIILIILVNFSFFRPDIWRNISDTEQFSGLLWDEGRSSSLTDFWPKYGSDPPAKFAPDQAEFMMGEGTTVSIEKTTKSSSYRIRVDSGIARVLLPQVYFPGWKATLDGKSVPIKPAGNLGQISLFLPAGDNHLLLKFTDTPVRLAGNLLSLLSVISIPLWLRKKLPG